MPAKAHEHLTNNRFKQISSWMQCKSQRNPRLSGLFQQVPKRFYTLVVINLPDDPNTIRLGSYSGPPQSIMYGITGFCVDPDMYQITAALSWSEKDRSGMPLDDLMPGGAELDAHTVAPGTPLAKAFAVLCK
jgi:hypothetical protein